ncbi:MAG: hypothetical protein JXR76_28590 [Deltaproteobacteria bacterium]|nr:hypothetical protein [Deltaproteobacteria bacterium]
MTNGIRIAYIAVFIAAIGCNNAKSAGNSHETELDCQVGDTETCQCGNTTQKGIRECHLKDEWSEVRV